MGQDRAHPQNQAVDRENVEGFEALEIVAPKPVKLFSSARMRVRPSRMRSPAYWKLESRCAPAPLAARPGRLNNDAAAMGEGKGRRFDIEHRADLGAHFSLTPF